MHPLLERQTSLQSDAAEVIETILKPILEPMGTLEIGGSYLYGLMYKPDIDLGVAIQDLEKRHYIDTCTKFLASEFVSGIRANDRVNFPHKYAGVRPTGYWIAPIIKYKDTEWSCDIWLQKPEWANGTHSRFAEPLQNLTDEQKVLILTLKKDLMADNRYGVGKEYESVDIYDAILSGEFADESTIRTHFGLA